MTAPRRLQLRRGNATAISTYTGAAGEVVIDTTNWILYVHDGSTVGGYATTTNVAVINNTITQANLGLKGYVDLANTIQSQQISSANLGMKGYVDSVASQSIYGNSNVKSYLTGGFDGNILPSANVTYSLGSPTRQWRDLFVSNTTIYLGGIPLSIDASGTLLVNGNVVQGAGGTTYSNVNVAAYLTTEGYAKTSDITTANLGLKGYVDQANTIQSAQIASANIGMKGYVDSQSFYSNTKVSAYLSTFNGNIGNLWIDSTTYSPDLWLRTRQNNNIYISPDDINHLFLPTAVSGSQLALAGYGLGGAGVFSSNSYVQLDGNGWDSGIELRTSFNSNNYTWTFGTNGALTLPESASGQANIVIPYDRSLNITTTDAETGNINQWLFNQSGLTYLPNNLYILDSQFVFFNNLGNAAQQSGKVNQNYELHVGGFYNKVWTFGHDGNLVLPAGGYLGNVWGEPSETTLVAAPGGFVAIANSSGDQYVDANDNNVQIGTNYRSGGGNVWLFYQNGWLVFPDGAIINNGFYKAASNSSVNLLSNNEHSQIRVDNANVEIYTSPDGFTQYQWTFGTDGNITLPSNVSSINYANGISILSGLGSGGGGSSSYGNVNVQAYTESMGFANYSNVNVAAYLPTYNGVIGSITTANITTTGSSGNISGVNVLTANTANVSGNVTALYFLGNGSQLTGLPAGYSNIQVAAYLASYGGNLNSGNTTISTLTVSGNAVVLGNLQVVGTLTTVNATGLSISNLIVVVADSAVNSTQANGAGLFVGGANSSILYNSINDSWSMNKPLVVNGNVTAGYFIGSGQFLSSLPGYAYSNVNVAAYLSTQGITSYSNVQVATYLPTYTGNIAAGNVRVSSGYRFETGNVRITNDNSSVTLTPDTTANALAGVVIGGSGYLLAPNNARNITLNYNGVNGAVGLQGNVTVGTASTSILTVNGNVLASGNVTAPYFIGNGALLTGIVAGSNYSNVQVATYLPTYTGVVTASNVTVNGNVTAQYLFGNGAFLTGVVTGSSYSNVQVATYLPTYSGNIANVRLGVSGVLTFADGTTLTTASAIGGSSYGNGNVASYLITNGYVNTNSAYGNGNVASYLITNQYVNANSAYSNANVTSYLPTHSGNIGVNSLIGTTPNVTLQANSYSTTYDIYGNVAFGNALYPVQIYATGPITTTGNVTVGGMGVAMPNRPAFRVYGGTAAVLQTTANVNLKGTTTIVDYNQGNYYNNTTGQFIAPVAGLYQTTLVARVGNNNGLNQVGILKNGLNTGANVVCFWETDTNTGTATHFGTSGVVRLAVGDYLAANIVAGAINFDGNDSWTVTYLG